MGGRRLVRGLAAGLMLATVAAGPQPSGAPHDHALESSELSSPIYPRIVTERQHVTTSTGADIYVEVTRPDPDAYPDARVPVIVHISPYNGGLNTDRRGVHLVKEATDEEGNQVGMSGWFAPRGYAWMSVDLRGTGKSSGCLDHLGELDQQDLADLADWTATQPWSDGRLGAIGHSYDGFSAAAFAAVGGPAVRSVVVSAGGASLYDHQFQWGVPFMAQWAGTSLYGSWSALRLASTDDPVRDAPGAVCGTPSASVADGPGQVTGQYGAWHAQRDHRDALAARDDLDIFVVQGIDDLQIRASAAEWFLTDREARDTDKLWIGPWTHNEGTHINGRAGQWLGALHEWFDRTLQDRDVSTGHAVEAFFEDDEMVVLPQWSPAAEPVTLYPDATGLTLSLDAPGHPGSVAFTARGNADGVQRVASTSLPIEDGGVDFVSAPLDADLVLVGLPQLALQASVTGEVVHLVAQLFSIDDRGKERVLNTCAIQPQLRNGIDTLAAVVPNEVMTLPLQCFSISHRVEAGHRLRLHVGTGSEHHIGSASVDARVEVHTGPDASSYSLPHRGVLTVHPSPPVTILS